MSRVGQCLIAHPNLTSENWFHRTVIYIYEDSKNLGTLGLCLNVPTTATVKTVCHNKGILYPEGITQIHRGGPVNQHALFLLHTDEWGTGNTIDAGSTYSISSHENMLEKLAMGDQPAYWRLFAGLCAWQPGQLDAELQGQPPYTSENSWLTCQATDRLLFSVDSDEQWEMALENSSSELFDQYF